MEEKARRRSCYGSLETQGDKEGRMRRERESERGERLQGVKGEGGKAATSEIKSESGN